MRRALTTPLGLLFSLTGCNSPDVGPRSTLTGAEAAAARAACTFKAGTLPGLTLAKDATIGSQIPIDTIVIVMMENRSFDHLLGNLPAQGQTDVDVAAANATNPDENGQPVSRYHLSEYCYNDPEHGWALTHAEWNNGKNDGFVKANNVSGDGKRAMGYYTEADLPVINSLAVNYAIGDRYFCSTLGPTWPNREYLYAASSFGHTGNDLLVKPLPNLMVSMQAAALGWHVYYSTLPGPALLADTYTKYIGDHFEKTNRFYADAAAGTLDPLVFLDAALSGNYAGENDFHPPGDPQLGDQFLSDVVKAVTTSPQWPHLALFITFDENGGIYDHVPPPSACAPDGIAPLLGPGDPAGGFDHYGFRVPLIVVSPYARPHFVSHVVHDHTSIARFVETRFHLPALSARDANADPLLEMFDFSKPALLKPPAVAAPVVDQQKLMECEQRYPQYPPDATQPGDAGVVAPDAGPGDASAAPDLAAPHDARTAG